MSAQNDSYDVDLHFEKPEFETQYHAIEYSAFNELLEVVKMQRAALEFECSNRCAIGLNPCNAREAIAATDEKLKSLGVL